MGLTPVRSSPVVLISSLLSRPFVLRLPRAFANRNSRMALLSLPIRRRILAEIQAHPGIHYHDISRALDLANGELSEQLRRLEVAGLIWSRSWLGRKHYFESTFRGDARAFIVSSRDRMTVGYLRDRPGSSATQIAAAMLCSRPTVSVHLARLRSLGLVESRRHGRRLLWFVGATIEL